MSIGKMIAFAEEMYPKKKFYHALRVAGYAFDKAADSRHVKPYDALMVGIAHDLLEDTDCTPDMLSEIMTSEQVGAVLELTKGDDEDYETYIMSIIEKGSDLAKLVKSADMKDHYMLSDTMTEKLHKKYQPYLKFFL
jgi:hypothetical protein